MTLTIIIRACKTFSTIVRPIAALQALIEADPYASFRLPADAKRVVTFLRDKARGKLALPIERDGARILLHEGASVNPSWGYTRIVGAMKDLGFSVARMLAEHRMDPALHVDLHVRSPILRGMHCHHGGRPRRRRT